MQHPPPTPGDYAELKRALRKRGNSLTKIANALQVDLSHVTRVASGERRSPRVEQAIADAVGAAPEYLFPKVQDAA